MDSILQCTERGWGQCREAIDFLYDKSSKFNREQIKCQSETDKNSISIVGDSGSDLLLSSGCPHRIEVSFFFIHSVDQNV